MINILNPNDLDLDQMRVILQGMLRVARADGANDSELVLIRDYYEACRSEVKGLADFEQLLRAPYDAALATSVLNSGLNSEQLKQRLLASCFLVAYVDGAVSAAEQSAISELIRELDIDEAMVANTHEHIKQLLLTQLSQVSDLETLQRIASMRH
jgi:uncharacterized membrane protein YebE (DUF533 family)